MKMEQTASADVGGVEPSLKEKGNEFFKAGNYLKAAALYTQAIKQDPNNASLYRAAVIVGSDPVPGVEKPLFKLVSAAQTILPDSDWAIDDLLREVGLTFHQLKNVPCLISKNIEKSLVEAFQPLGISDWNSLFWIVHPVRNCTTKQVLSTMNIQDPFFIPADYTWVSTEAKRKKMQEKNKSAGSHNWNYHTNRLNYYFYMRTSRLQNTRSCQFNLPRVLKARRCNRAAAFLHLVKLSKALADAETTITLNPQWEKGYFRKGCILEAMERYEESLFAFEAALQHNPQSLEVVKKIKRVSQLVRDKRRAEEVEELRSNVQMEKHLDTFKTELCARYGLQEESKEVLSFVTETMERAVKSWHETSKVDPGMYFLLDLQSTETEKYAPVVNIDKAFESPQTHSECFTFLRKYAEDSFSKAACLVSPKSIISYPQVWKGQGSRKWKHGLHDGLFIQFESPFLRKLWFIPSSTEKGKTLCRDPVALDISAHELLPRIFKEKQ